MKYAILIGCLMICALFACGCIDELTVDTDRTASIKVIDKTTEIDSGGFSSYTVYKILGSDGVVYFTHWQMYRGLEINQTYLVKAKNRGGIDPIWYIYQVDIKSEDAK